MQIGEIDRVTDLAENEQAFPEQGIVYGIRTISQFAVVTDVEYVVRRGNQLIAKGFNGEDFPVSGSGDFVMTPRPAPVLR